MANSSQEPVKKFGGDYERNFTLVTNALETRLAGTNIKHAAVAYFPINLHGVFIFGKLLNCPDKAVNWTYGWNFQEICDQHDIDRPGPDNNFFREVLASLEEDFFDDTAKHHCMVVLNEALQIVLEYFTDYPPEVGEINSTDPFCVFRFLQKINNNYLNWVKKNSAKLTKTIFNEAQNGWKGGNVTDFTRYIQNIRKMMVDLPSSICASFSERFIFDMIITSLLKHEELKGIHTIIH